MRPALGDPSDHPRRLDAVSVVTEMVLVIEARDLDTDERSVATFPVAMPADEGRQRSQLAQAVAQVHPDARIRSFDRGAASFTDSRQLVVAHYEPPQDRPTAVT